MTALSQMPHVYRIAVQTNLSAPINDFASADRETLALWTTFHPSQTSIARFVARCRTLDETHVRYSVGVVGLREHFEAIEELRKELRPDVYLWINAYKRDPDYYQPGEIERLGGVDPYFHWNMRRYPSVYKPCNAGETAFTVDGRGDIRRCHFIGDVIGNIYDANFTDCLRSRRCTAATCGCHIGYVHRPGLRLQHLYGDGLLERIPSRWPEVLTDFSINSDPEYQPTSEFPI